MSAESNTAGTATPEELAKGGGKKRRAGILLAVILITGIFFGIRFWIKTNTHITTDNAFIEAHVHSVASRVPGMVTRVMVTENQFVKQGDLLVELDPADYRVRVATADASLAMARNETSSEYAEVKSARATVGQEQARLDQAETDLARGKKLLSREVISREQLEKLETARKVASMGMREAKENLRKAEATAGLSAKGGREARVAMRQSQLDEATLAFTYTRICAPADGYITRKAVEPGNYVQPGQPLLAVVRLDDVWVTANYKERQLAHVKPGQPVEFDVDAFPGSRFKGKVESIMAGTGAAFSMLPPENATGNYVKVVQRIPVHIVVDKGSDPNHLLRTGMSVVPTILVDRKIGAILRELTPF